MKHRLEHQVAERRRAEEQFRAVVENAPNGLVMVDERGTILLVNRGTKTLFGRLRDEIIGQPVEVLVPEADRAAHPKLRHEYAAPV